MFKIFFPSKEKEAPDYLVKKNSFEFISNSDPRINFVSPIYKDLSFDTDIQIEQNFTKQTVLYVNTSLSGTDEIYRNEVNRDEFDVEVTEEFIKMINDDDFESGFISNSERYVSKLLQEKPNTTKQLLNDLFLSNYGDKHFTAGILHILSHMEYFKVYPQAQTMALAGLQHESAEVREYAIRAFENWDDSKSLTYLRHIKCKEEWMQEYLNQVVQYLER